MRKMFLLILLISSVVYSQLLEENFDYIAGTNLSDNGWTVYSGTGINPITINSNGLSYSGYASSNIGNSIDIDNLGEDYYKSLSSSQSSGTIYFSYMINVSDATSGGGEYFIGLGSTAAGTVAGRLWLKQNGLDNIAFGISKTSNSPSYTDFIYSFNTTYLIVVKYTINSGSSNDDVSLFIITGSIPETEPSATLTHPTETGSDPSNISVVAVRQDITTNIVTIDGIRVATSWSQAPLHVELISFTAKENNNTVTLHWVTATEVNNYGFNVERRTENEEWKNIAFVQGNGNSNSPKEYRYTDQPNGGKEFSYRLKQIDFDGSYEYSGEITVTMEEIKEYKLYQNYPNPFNPETIISYSLPTQSYVRLKVYDMLGKEITTLIDKQQEAGNYITTFNTQDYLLSSGVYYIVLQSGNFTETKKCILIK